MKPRRLGCLAFGIGWATIFVLTNFGLAIGDPVDGHAINPLQIAFWTEVAALLVGLAVFYRAEMRDGDF